MKFRSAILADARGSMGGMTASRNKGGSYFRSRVKPTNPNSEAQQEVRQAFALAVAGWSILTAGQRASWNSYAEQTPVTDSLGEQIKHSGRAWYVAQAAFLLRIGENAVATAPITPGIDALGEPTGLVLSAADGLTVQFNEATAANPILLAQMGPPISPGVLDYHGPYTFAAYDSSNALADQAVEAGRWGSPVLNQRRPLRFRTCDSVTGKVSNEYTTIVTVVA